MAYKCSMCGVNDVEQPGEVCRVCAAGQDSYAADIHSRTRHSRKILINGGSDLVHRDPYGNDITPGQDPQQKVTVCQNGRPAASSDNSSVDAGTSGASSSMGNTGKASVKKTSGQPVTRGISKNISVDTQKKSALFKWFRTLFTGIPFTMDDYITMFQVFPDFGGQALNAMGNACDQVIVYGKLNAGALSENNEVEVFGQRDSNNNIIAKSIRNVASGTTIVPAGAIGPLAVWIITILVIVIIGGAAGYLGLV